MGGKKREENVQLSRASHLGERMSRDGSNFKKENLGKGAKGKAKRGSR